MRVLMRVVALESTEVHSDEGDVKKRYLVEFAGVGDDPRVQNICMQMETSRSYQLDETVSVSIEVAKVS